MIYPLRLPILFALLMISWSSNGIADDASNKEIKIGFGVMLDGTDPIAGTALCEIRKTCRLIDRENPEIRIDITLDYSYGTLTTEMQVRCKDHCSFETGRPIKIFRTQREHHLFADEIGIISLLVSKPRKKIGKILLIYPDQ